LLLELATPARPTPQVYGEASADPTVLPGSGAVSMALSRPSPRRSPAHRGESGFSPRRLHEGAASRGPPAVPWWSPPLGCEANGSIRGTACLRYEPRFLRRHCTCSLSTRLRQWQRMPRPTQQNSAPTRPANGNAILRESCGMRRPKRREDSHHCLLTFQSSPFPETEYACGPSFTRRTSRAARPRFNRHSSAPPLLRELGSNDLRLLNPGGAGRIARHGISGSAITTMSTGKQLLQSPFEESSFRFQLPLLCWSNDH